MTWDPFEGLGTPEEYLESFERRPAKTYGPMLNAIQDMWAEHEERAQGICGCAACFTGVAFFDAAVEAGEAKR